MAFEANETRDLFYRAAIELVDLALHKKIDLTVAEALAVLLQTWNMAYYRFHPFDADHFAALDQVLANQQSIVGPYRNRCIESYQSDDQPIIQRLFTDFEAVLGPVGTAKCLHLLAPRFFPLWDRAIAKAYGLALRSGGGNAGRYVSFMEVTKRQAIGLATNGKVLKGNPLKALDEYNYCKFTKAWL